MRRLLIIVMAAGLMGPLAAETITYQGQLQDDDGPYTGTPGMEFRLFDSLEGGNQVGGEIVLSAVPVTDGLFQVDLDFGSVYDAGPVYLEVTVAGSTLEPRQTITAAPIAVHALTAGGDELWTEDGSDIHYSDGNVGIGTESPGVPLEVEGSGQFGGDANEATGTNSFVTGGSSNFPNRAVRTNSFVGGGRDNFSDGPRSAIVGGNDNATPGLTTSNAFIGGGDRNTASSANSFVGGGALNTADGRRSAIAGGHGNSSSGMDSFIAGGSSNKADGDVSFAGGRQAHAEHDGTFVWADNQWSNFVSTGEDQFLIRADGGVGVGTNDPDGAQLHVDGIARVSHLEFHSLSPASGTDLCVDSSSRVVVCGSSKRLKHDIETLDAPLSLVNALRPVRYNWNSSGESDIGLIAEEVAEVIPEIVHFDEDGQVDTLQYSRVAAILVGAIQEQGQEFSGLLEDSEKRLAESERRLEQLEAENAELGGLAERNAELEDRLAALEALLLEDRQVAERSQ